MVKIAIEAGSDSDEDPQVATQVVGNVADKPDSKAPNVVSKSETKAKVEPEVAGKAEDAGSAVTPPVATTPDDEATGSGQGAETEINDNSDNTNDNNSSLAADAAGETAVAQDQTTTDVEAGSTAQAEIPVLPKADKVNNDVVDRDIVNDWVEVENVEAETEEQGKVSNDNDDETPIGSSTATSKGQTSSTAKADTPESNDATSSTADAPQTGPKKPTSRKKKMSSKKRSKKQRRKKKKKSGKGPDKKPEVVQTPPKPEEAVELETPVEPAPETQVQVETGTGGIESPEGVGQASEGVVGEEEEVERVERDVSEEMEEEDDDEDDADYDEDDEDDEDEEDGENGNESSKARREERSERRRRRRKRKEGRPRPEETLDIDEEETPKPVTPDPIEYVEDPNRHKVERAALRVAAQRLPRELPLLGVPFLAELARTVGAPADAPNVMWLAFAEQFVGLLTTPPNDAVPNLTEEMTDADLEVKAELYWRCCIGLLMMPVPSLLALETRWTRRAQADDPTASPKDPSAGGQDDDAFVPPKVESEEKIRAIKNILPWYAMTCKSVTQLAEEKARRAKIVKDRADAKKKLLEAEKARKKAEKDKKKKQAAKDKKARELQQHRREQKAKYETMDQFGQYPKSLMETDEQGQKREIPPPRAKVVASDNTKAAHTYDRGYKKWDAFDVDTALAEASDDDNAAPAAQAQSTDEDEEDDDTDDEMPTIEGSQATGGKYPKSTEEKDLDRELQTRLQDPEIRKKMYEIFGEQAPAFDPNDLDAIVDRKTMREAGK